MKLLIATTLVAASIMLISCTHQPEAATPQTSESDGQQSGAIEGTVVGLSDTHGNAYTSIRPGQYEELGLVAGESIRLALANQELTLPIGRDYTDVPSGTPLAVLHREGLTFAIRDGNFSTTYGVAPGSAFTIYHVRQD